MRAADRQSEKTLRDRPNQLCVSVSVLKRQALFLCWIFISNYHQIRTNSETGGDRRRSEHSQAGTCVSLWPSCHCPPRGRGGGSWGVFVSITEQQTGPLEMKGSEWSQSKRGPAGGPYPTDGEQPETEAEEDQWGLAVDKEHLHTYTHTSITSLFVLLPSNGHIFDSLTQKQHFFSPHWMRCASTKGKSGRKQRQQRATFANEHIIERVNGLDEHRFLLNFVCRTIWKVNTEFNVFKTHGQQNAEEKLFFFFLRGMMRHGRNTDCSSTE